MNRRRRLSILLIACGLIVAGGFLLLPPEREPTHKGVTLTGWLSSYDSGAVKGSNKQEAAAAVRHIGTNAIPFLLEWMRYEPSPWRRQWRNAFQKLPHPVDRLGRLSDSVYGLKWPVRNRLALEGFEILGPDASSAIPELTRIMQNAKSYRLWFAAAQALGFIGQDGLAPLLLALGDDPGDWRRKAIVLMVIGRMEERGLDITAAVPALLQKAGDLDSTVNFEAWTTLEQISERNPSLYLPVISTRLRDTNEIVRVASATLLISLATNLQPAMLKEATNVLSAARPELVKRFAEARGD